MDVLVLVFANCHLCEVDSGIDVDAAVIRKDLIAIAECIAISRQWISELFGCRWA